MTALQVLIEAYRSLSANRLRTGLTMLGIIIGIASVVLMLAVGDAVRGIIDEQLAVLGSNLLIVVPGTPTEGGVKLRVGELPTLTIDDVEEMNRSRNIEGAAAAIQGYFQVNYGVDNSNNVVLGITPEMFHIRNWNMESGVEFTADDVRSGKRVVVIGANIASQYFYKQDPLGRIIRIEGAPLTIIGVLGGKGRMFDGLDLGDLLLTPITSIPVRLQLPRTINYAIVQARDSKKLEDAEDDVRELLRDRHRITGDRQDDFQVTNLASIAEAGASIGGGVSIVLGVIGAISLIVGGIGIMNIMLVSVSERVREIGIRMAIGAKPHHVLTQFLCESIMMCLVGGAVGTALAALGAWGVNQSGKVTMTISAAHVIAAALFSTVIGLFFGYYPAHRASRLLPIECLRQG